MTTDSVLDDGLTPIEFSILRWAAHYYGAKGYSFFTTDEWDIGLRRLEHKGLVVALSLESHRGYKPKTKCEFTDHALAIGALVPNEYYEIP